MRLLLTDIKLPVLEATTILSYLESNNMPARIPDRNRELFNCWGFTAWYLQWEEKAIWLNGRVMERHLKEHTQPISKGKVKPGDVAVFYSGQYLTHTAIMLPGGNVVCHKPGNKALCIDTLENAVTKYGSVIFARVVKKVKKEFDNSPECVRLCV